MLGPSFCFLPWGSRRHDTECEEGPGEVEGSGEGVRSELQPAQEQTHGSLVPPCFPPSSGPRPLGVHVTSAWVSGPKPCSCPGRAGWVGSKTHSFARSICLRARKHISHPQSLRKQRIFCRRSMSASECHLRLSGTDAAPALCLRSQRTRPGDSDLLAPLLKISHS